MAPQLGIGTFRIRDKQGNTVGFASSNWDGNCGSVSDEAWALYSNENPTPGHAVFPTPSLANNPVELVFLHEVPLPPGMAPRDALCQYLPSIGENPADYCIRVHEKIYEGTCP